MDIRKALPPQPQVTDEHIRKQLRKLYTLVYDTFGFKTDRTISLVDMYVALENRIRTAPASSKLHYHNAYPGGYLDHVLHVVDTAHLLHDVYLKLGGWVDWTKQEMVFAALHHDLGKLGDDDGPMYIPTHDPRDHAKGVYFKYNDSVTATSCFDRTIYLLNKFRISYSKKEMLAIKMADGLFDSINDTQYKTFGFFPNHSDLGYFIHWSDWMATKTEAGPLRRQFILNLSNLQEQNP